MAIEKPKPKRLGRYQINERNGNFHFNLHSGNGEIISTGKSKSTLTECFADILSAKSVGGDPENYHFRRTADGKQHYFVLIDPSDKDIKMTSETYPHASSAKAGRDSSVNNSQTTTIQVPD